jgi:hypothetical protein
LVSDADWLGIDAESVVSDAQSLGVRNQRLVVISSKSGFEHGTVRFQCLLAVNDST